LLASRALINARNPRGEYPYTYLGIVVSVSASLGILETRIHTLLL